MKQPLNFRRVLTTDAAYRQVFDLREELLRKPISLSLHDEDLSGEVNDFILIAEYDNSIVGCLILTPIKEGTLQLRQMAVATNQQGKNVGMQLVSYAEQFARDKNYNRIILHARIVAQGFYDKLGYQQTSDIFTEVGIPHVVMEKEMA